MNFSIKNSCILFFIKSYFCLIVGFYPLALMYRHEYQTIPIKLEGVLCTVFFGMLLNIGLLLAVTDFGLRWKKSTIGTLLISAISSFLIFYIVDGNPMALVESEEWPKLRIIFSVISLGIYSIVIFLVGTHKNDK